MKKGFVLLGALGAVTLIVAASAAAYVTPPVVRSGVHSLLTCVYPYKSPPFTNPTGVLGGNGDSKHAILSTTDLYLSIGWGALTPSQVNNFLGAEYGSIVISNYVESTKTIGSAVDTISWGDPNSIPQTDVSLWTPPMAVNDPTLNGGKPFTRTQLFAHVGQLPGGTYWVAPDLELTQAQFDGSNTVKKGPWFTTGCEMVVS